MSSYRHRPIQVEAIRWFKQGDSPHVGVPLRPSTCRKCIASGSQHGALMDKTLVCPGDWVVKSDSGISILTDMEFQTCYFSVPAPKSSLLKRLFRQ